MTMRDDGGADGEGTVQPAAAADLSGRLFAAASHDLRQPLAALSLLVGALDGRLADEQSRTLLKAMDTAIQAMTGMVEGHLDLIRLEAGLLEPDQGNHVVNGMLMRLALQVAPRFADRGLRFTVMPCSALVRTDAVLLERILEGLVANALRFTARGRVVLGCRRSGGDLRIEVWDTGRGLSTPQLASLRRELEQPGADGHGILGLGLMLARGLARRLGHRLEVRSVEGRGTVFAVVIPRTAEGAEEAPVAAPAVKPALDLGRARVLVIEDDPLVLGALDLLLDQWGCTVIGAESLEAAVERLGPDPQPPDLVISDLRLKGTANGIVAIRQLAKLVGRPVPGLILTGDTDPRRLREARLSGYPLLHKPVAPLALRTAMARLFGPDRLTP